MKLIAMKKGSTRVDVPEEVVKNFEKVGWTQIPTTAASTAVGPDPVQSPVPPAQKASKK